MYKEIISYSVPFVIVSLNFPLFNLVDQFTHNNALDAQDFMRIKTISLQF